MSQAPQPPQFQAQASDVIRWFHRLYYDVGRFHKGTWEATYWMGIRTQKCPLDVWIYQELLYAIRPHLIIETGTHYGGSALCLCHLCDLLGIGEVVTIDIEPPANPPSHPRLRYLTGSSTAPDIVQQVRQLASSKSPVLVILDSDHSCRHVLEEMRAYHDIVTPGSYMIVEDSNVNGRPVAPDFGPGPTEAIEQFFRENDDFEIDQSCEKLLLTFNPNGYLRKRSNPNP